MGVCLSCFGASDDQNQLSNRDRRRNGANNERTPLLQDPTSLLQHPTIGTPHEQEDQGQLDHAALQKIVDRTGEKLIDIQSALKKASGDASGDGYGHGESTVAASGTGNAEQVKYLIDRLQSDSRSDGSQSRSPTSSAHGHGSAGDAEMVWSRERDRLVKSDDSMTDRELRILQESCDSLTAALNKVKTKKSVGDVVVMLNWD